MLGVKRELKLLTFVNKIGLGLRCISGFLLMLWSGTVAFFIIGMPKEVASATVFWYIMDKMFWISVPVFLMALALGYITRRKGEEWKAALRLGWLGLLILGSVGLFYAIEPLIGSRPGLLGTSLSGSTIWFFWFFGSLSGFILGTLGVLYPNWFKEESSETGIRKMDRVPLDIESHFDTNELRIRHIAHRIKSHFESIVDDEDVSPSDIEKVIKELISHPHIDSSLRHRTFDVNKGRIEHITRCIISEFDSIVDDEHISPSDLKKVMSYLHTYIPFKRATSLSKNRCMVCNLPLGRRDLLQCPNCLTRAHKRHLLEWLHVRGNCPICGIHLNERDVNQ